MNKLKNFFNNYKPFFGTVMTGLGIIAVYDWIIFPGLTTKNTFTNIMALIGGTFLILIIGIVIWEGLIKTNKQDKNEQDESIN